MHNMKSIIKFIVAVILSILLTLFIYHQMTTSKLLTKIGGFSVLIVNSGSMEPELKIGDIILIKECKEYKTGDIVTYNVDNSYLITHRIIKEEGNYVITKGDSNNTPDEKVNKNNIEGKVIFNSKLLKLIYDHWVVAVLVIFLILILL